MRKGIHYFDCPAADGSDGPCDCTPERPVGLITTDDQMRARHDLHASSEERDPMTCHVIERPAQSQ